MSDTGAPNGYQKLPPGWDCKYDQTTGNCYYINYLTKAMQLEDPRAGRNSYKQLQNERCSTESIPLQHMAQSSHHSSPYHVVHPSNNLTAVRAFQERERGQQPALHNLSTSPLLSASSRAQLEMSSPLPLQRARLASNMSRRSTIQETSFSHQSESQAVVTKIQNMFPTADENHIRLLLKRYYNREAVVISALQVEKHPVTMPGPFVTPPAQRHLFHSNSAFYMTPPARRPDMGASRITVTSRTASPLPGGRFGSLMSMQSGPGQHIAAAAAAAGIMPPPALHGSPQWRSSPKPHSSPKMKLRYMKNIFPKADEMLLLDILANADNNVQFASEKLISLGYAKRDMQQPHRPNNRPPHLDADQKSGNEQGVQHIPLRPKEYTAEQKTDMEALFKERYPQIAERIILMALESVNYAEDRAMQILQIVQDEDEQRSQKHALPKSSATDSALTLPVDQVDAAAAHRQRQHSAHLDNGHNLDAGEFQSLIARMATLGPNAQLAKGADEKLLLADYVTWNGPNTTLSPKQAAQGADPGLLAGERSYKPAGRNPELCKGAKKELAKGSIYAQGKGANIKCN